MTEAPDEQLGSILGAIAAGRSIGVVEADLQTTPSPKSSNPSWLVPSVYPKLVLPAQTLVDQPELQAALRGWSALEQVEVVVLLPPMGRADNSRVDMSELAAAALAAAIGPTQTLVTLVPSRRIGRLADGRRFIESLAPRSLAAVVEMTAGTIFEGIRPGLSLCFVVFEPDAQIRVTYLSRGRRTGLAELGQEYGQLQNGRPRTLNGFSLSANDAHGSPLLPALADPERLRRVQEASVIGQLSPLGDLCEVTRGTARFSSTEKNYQPGLVPVLSARMFVGDDIDLRAASEWVSVDRSDPLQAGDIVIRAFVQPGTSLRAAQIEETHLPLVAGGHVVVLRPKQGLSSSATMVLRHFVQSDRFLDQLESTHTGSMGLQVREITEVQVPIPDANFLQALEFVESAESAFQSWRNEATDLLLSSMDSDDLVEARRRLIENSNLLRQRQDAAQKLDDLSFRVATRYPLPVAYRWRAALAAQGAPGALQSILHAQEVLLAYLAIIAIKMAEVGDLELSALKDIRGRLRPGRGVGIGDWRAILYECAESKQFRTLPVTHPFVEVREFFAETEIREASTRLTALRNDLSHLREFGPGELEATIPAAWADLELLFSAAEFVTEYPLVRVLETRWDDLDHQNEVYFCPLAGDNPVVPRESIVVESNAIEAGSLYLRDRGGTFWLLRPLLIGQECPTCGHWSTFHPDRVDASGAVEYKSLEHGHPIRPKNAGRHLHGVGFLEVGGS